MSDAAPSALEDETIRACPLCEGPLTEVYSKFKQRVVVCDHCHSSITIPGPAWRVRKLKKLKYLEEKLTRALGRL